MRGNPLPIRKTPNSVKRTRPIRPLSPLLASRHKSHGLGSTGDPPVAVGDSPTAPSE